MYPKPSPRLRAAVPPDGEIFLESTPNGAGGNVLRRVAARSANRLRPPLLSLVVGPELSPQGGNPRVHRPGARAHAEARSRRRHRSPSAARCVPTSAIARRKSTPRIPRVVSSPPATASSIATSSTSACKQPPVISESTDNGKLLTFFPPVVGGLGVTPKEYIIGVDPAGGGSDGDYACAQVIERSTGLQCAELRGHFTPQELAARVAVLGRKYNEALVAVERNNHGHAVIAHLTMTAGYQNLYPGGGPPGMAHHRGFASAHVGELCRRAVERVVPLSEPAAVAGVSHLHPSSGWHVGCRRRRPRRHRDGHGHRSGGPGRSGACVRRSPCTSAILPPCKPPSGQQR